MMGPGKIRQSWRALSIGVAATLLGCAVLGIGIADRLDRFGLNLHFQRFGSIKADPRIVLVDIDDQALALMPEWPWPRRRFAQLVTTLDELGAEAIVLDLVFADPTAPRSADARLSRHYDLESSSLVMGDPASAGLIYDDNELHDALSLAGNVYIGTTASIVHTRDGRPPLHVTSRRSRGSSNPSADYDLRINQAVDWLQHESAIDADSLARRFPHGDKNETSRLLLIARAILLLEESYSHTESQAISSLAKGDADSDTLRAVWPTAKRVAASRLARQFFDQRGEADWPAFLRFALPDVPPHALTPDRATLIQAFRAERSWRLIQPKWSALQHGARPTLPTAHDIVLPLDKIAEASRGVGLVSFVPDEVDGRLRSIPLLSVARDRLLPHLGFLVAANLTGVSGDDITIQSGRIDVGELRVPIDRRGETLINWHTTSGSARWEELFTHIPVTRVLEIALNRETIEDNRKRLGLAWAELVKARHKETPAEYNEYVRLVNERWAHAEVPDELNERISGIEQEALAWLERMVNLWRPIEPQDVNERAERDQIMRWHETLALRQLAERIRESDQRLERRNAELLAELRPQLDGTVCLVGYTASAQADLVATPIDDNMPGVMAHANVINMFLQGRFIRTASLWTDLLLLALAGLLVTWNAAHRGPLMSLILSLALALALFALGGVMFYVTGIHLATIPMIVGLTLPWGAVTVYRQLTEERSRRSFERALGQYTSPAVAARIAENADARDLAPQSAQVTCFFCDLEGFTALSERLGPERTRQVLNPYLQNVSRVLAERNAIVNKFIGDGVFAFFNAPILPCDDHGRAGCEAALQAVASTQGTTRPGQGVLSAGEVRLTMRVGLATGTVFVGDYGSDTKLDYTCIGDTVNVASRLENANKVLGTTILVDQATHDHYATTQEVAAPIRTATTPIRTATVRERVSTTTQEIAAPIRTATVRERVHNHDALQFRPVGLIEVPGRIQPVSAFELIGHASEVDESRRRFIEQFEAAIRHYQVCEWGLCLAILKECAQIDPHDQLVRLYSHAATRLQQTGAPDNWNRALEHVRNNSRS
jgi:class 3 adenylate cyclase/CHASE2 domain-containing sensor protein